MHGGWKWCWVCLGGDDVGSGGLVVVLAINLFFNLIV